MPAAMRKLLVSCLAPLLMLLAQQGAALHELGHLSQDAARTAQAGEAHGDRLCLSCLAFSAVAGLVRPDPFRALLLSFDHPLPVAVAVSRRAAEAPTPQACGPPPVL